MRLWLSARPKQWQIAVSGTRYLQVPEIQNMILFLLRSNPQGITQEDIRQALLLNPRIKNADVQIDGKKMNIRIVEITPALLVDYPNSMVELSDQMKLLQEDFLGNPLSFDLNLPLYSVSNATQKNIEKNKKEFTKYQRDIISLWEATKNSYAFIWERISEIEILWQQGKPRFSLYLTTSQTRISVGSEISLALLQRLWAIFYYMEQISSSQVTQQVMQVDVFQRHAIVKAQKPQLEKKEQLDRHGL